MALNAEIQIVVQDLPENDIWFANAQSWKNYWANVTGYIELTGAVVNTYTDTAYNYNLYNATRFNVDGTPYDLPSMEMLVALQAKFNTLMASYKGLRTALKDAGLITEV